MALGRLNCRLVATAWVVLASIGCDTGSPPGFTTYSASTIQEAPRRPDFDSYEQAKNWVRTNSRLIHERADTTRSSWIQGADFYAPIAADSGYLILDLQGREYLYENVPRTVWTGFATAQSMGNFYNYNIKGRYGLRLRQSLEYSE